MVGGAQVLRDQWQASCRRLAQIVAGLTDEEYFWEPAAACWTVRRDPVSGSWSMDYPHAHSDTPPMTTIAWRLLHITHGNHIYWEHAFGPGRRNFTDLAIMGSAETSCADLGASQRRLTETLASIDHASLDSDVPTQFGEAWPARRVFDVLLVEQVHHGAEISLLRDLQRGRAKLRDE